MRRRHIWAPGLVVLFLALGVGAATAAASKPVPGGARLTVVLPLRADDRGLARFAQAVSTPGSPSYGAYEPLPVLARRFGASPATAARVIRVLRAAGARGVSLSPTGMFVQASLSPGQATRLFHATLSLYRGMRGDYIAPAAPSGARARAAAARPAIPAALRGLITGVVGLSTEPVIPAHAVPSRARVHGAAAAVDPGSPGPGPEQAPSGYQPATGTPAGCAGALSTHAFTPNQYLTAYGFDPLRQNGLTGQGERVALIEIDGFKHSDVQTFATCFGLRLPKISTSVVGASSALPPGGESTLDLEALDAAAPGLDQIEVYESPGDAAQVIDTFAAPLIKPGAKPQVLSASLGLCEPNMYESFGRAGIDSVEREVDLAAATGITLLSASGDDGSAGCQDQQGAPVDRLAVDYPASSPDVTAVGGTNFVLNPDNTLSQQFVWNDTSVDAAAGGGGTSALFRRPGYQSGIAGLSGRGVPDVSMLADVAPGYAIYCTASSQPGCNGWTAIGGTSAAAPLLAGGLALVNQDLHRQNHEFLGLINPLLYKLGGSAGDAAQLFDDVTRIGNDLGPFINGSGGQPLGCCEASTGWDPASGWGSMNLRAFDAFALQALPTFGNVSLSIPGAQRVVRQRGLQVNLSCSAHCRANAFGFVTISGGGGFNLQSTTLSFGRPATRRLTIRFTRAQVKRLRRALARHRSVHVELFGLALDSRGQVAKVTAGVQVSVRR